MQDFINPKRYYNKQSNKTEKKYYSNRSKQVSNFFTTYGCFIKKINYFVLETRNIGSFSYFLVFEKSFKIFVAIIIGLRIQTINYGF